MKTILIISLLNACWVLSFSQTTNAICKPILYLYVDKMPLYEGGQSELKKFIDYNIQWPGEFDGQGTVLTSFVITREGIVSDIKIEKTLCLECDNEAIRLIKLFPLWKPGVLDSQNVDVIIYLPIQFRISK